MSDRVKMWGVMDPEGNLVDVLPRDCPDNAYLAASETSQWGWRSRSGDDLMNGTDLLARCWRANGGEFGWGSDLAREIAELMGYRAVRVRMVREDG